MSDKKLAGILLLLVVVVITGSLFVKSARVANEGEMVYRSQCLSCHGDNGKGESSQLGTALNNQQFLNTVSDEDLVKYIENGRQGTSMPSFAAKMDDEQLKKLVKYIRSWQTENKNYYAPSQIAGDSHLGKPLYENYCASCHAVDGKGKMGLGTALNNPQFLQLTTDQQIWMGVAYGREQTAMGPALKGQNGVKQLTEKQISDIVAYVRTFDKKGTSELSNTH